MDVIDCYQQHHNGLPLLLQFEPYLKKFYDLIRHQKINWHNYDVREFIKLYLADPHLRKSCSRAKFIPNQVVITANQMIEQINQLFDPYHGPMHQDEVYQELCCVLFELAKRYQKKETSFQMYVYHSFRYELKRRLDRLQKQKIQTVSYCDQWEQPVMDTASESEKNIDLWIEGHHASHPFDQLRLIERLILVFTYVFEKTDIEISRVCGYHANYIGQLRRKIVQQIQCGLGVG